jgi:type IV pilus assembly protein PilV
VSRRRIRASQSRAGLRGLGLLDALIALAILAFGLLALTQLQSRLVASSTESQARLAATQMADELVSLALADPDAGNAGCYTLPAAGACGSAGARTLTDNWRTDTLARLPGTGSATATYDAATGQLTVTLGWTGKASDEARSLAIVTDIRP